MVRGPKALAVWMNGERVGTWSISSRGIHQFAYANEWLASPEVRPLSLSLPLAPIKKAYQGQVVSAYFENLLPDSTEIRQRIKNRYQAPSLQAFDLLSEVGRDCVGAIQLLPMDTAQIDYKKIEARPISEHDIARLLRGITSIGVNGQSLDDEFRISLAGAQEKTALLYRNGQWFIPKGPTPSTHILKLPLGRIGGLNYDMSNSVWNEWLCCRIARSLGLPVAPCEVRSFDEINALVVERFDRKYSRDGTWIVRIPQEDFCQVTGTPPDAKYESDGGPGIESIMDYLLGSANALLDRKNFFKAQMLFWFLAAPDGHAKNFSVFIENGGRFRLTPLYDIISAYPLLGHGLNLIPSEKLKLAMAFRGAHKHYEWAKVSSRHFRVTAKITGFEGFLDEVINELVAGVPSAINEVSRNLPPGFPAIVADSIFSGLEKQRGFLA